jgi:hypothetical protein
MMRNIDNLIMLKKNNNYQISHKKIKISLKYKSNLNHLTKILKIKM